MELESTFRKKKILPFGVVIPDMKFEYNNKEKPDKITYAR